MKDTNAKIVLFTDDNIDKYHFIQVSFTAIADIPCPMNIRNVRDIDLQEIEGILKADYGLKAVNLNNVRIMSKIEKDIEDK